MITGIIIGPPAGPVTRIITMITMKAACQARPGVTVVPCRVGPGRATVTCRESCMPASGPLQVTELPV